MEGQFEVEVAPLLAAHADKIRLNEPLFERVKQVYDRRATLDLDDEQMRLLEKTYRMFVRAGALLDAEQKARLKEINAELSLAAVKFRNSHPLGEQQHVLMLSTEELNGLPANVRVSRPEKAAQLRARRTSMPSRSRNRRV